MPSSLTIIRQRRGRRDHARRSSEGRATRLGFGCVFIGSALAAVVILAAALAYADLTRDLPPVETLPVLLDPQNGLLRQPTRLYDRSGAHLIAVLAPEDAPRRFLAYPQIPKALIDATLVLADPDFWEHPGYLTDGWRDPESHPTLAQKLVSDLLLWNEPPAPRRALRERILAAQITARYGREQVLEWYLNSANYGKYAYGIDSAARLYFDKSAASLDLSEAALLASVGQAPALNPIDTPQAAEGRRLETLQIMQTMGVIQEIPLPLAPLPSIVEKGTGGAGSAPAFTSLALAQLGQRFDRTRIERGGLTILTTLDYDLQLQAACAVQTQLARLAGAFMVGQSPTISEIPAADGSPCQAARLLPTFPPGVALTNAAASALVLDPRSGQVLAAVGDTRPGQESAHFSVHPSSTLITPFIYLTGFTRGLNPASLGWDIPAGLIANLDSQYHGPVRLRIALANDYMPPALAILEQMGTDNLQRIAQSFGLHLPADGALLEAGTAFSPLEIAAAYGIFANQGTLAGQAISGAPLRPVAVLKVAGVDNSLWLDWTTPQFTPVVSLQLAYLMNHVLSDETARWPSLGHPNPLEIGRPAGAKLGRTLDGQSAWVAGYTPQRVVVVWMGNVEGVATSPGLSADLWHALTQYAVRDLPSESWTAPAGIVTMDVCDRSGLLPTASCPNVVSEVFITGNEPTHADALYQTFQINRETGYLATVFTSPELVEERVYMVVPPEARTWAESAALPIPPTVYDVIQQPTVLPDVHITAPALFEDVRGKITITGTAAGTAFAYYRLEYGQGLNPQFWTQIGSDVKAPVAESTLAEWDTSDLNGLYALRLFVVRADSRLEMAVTQVSIDNTPPQVSILYPAEGQKFSRAQDKQVAFQAQVSDAYLADVKFYVDNVLVGKVSAAPFSLLWQASAGKHTLRLVAHDRAGNEAEARVDFVVAR